MNALSNAHVTTRRSDIGSWRASRARRKARMSRRTAGAVARQVGAVSTSQRAKRGKGKKPGPPVFDGLVQRLFTVDGPNRLWLTDLTER